MTTPPTPTLTQCDGPVCSTVTPTTPDVSHTTINTRCEVCPSCFISVVIACVITAITTALLATFIFVLVQSAVRKRHPKLTSGGAETGASAGEWEGQEYELMDTGEGGVAVNDPTYVEDDAYGTHTGNLNDSHKQQCVAVSDPTYVEDEGTQAGKLNDSRKQQSVAVRNRTHMKDEAYGIDAGCWSF